jgi:hypothetical protein
MLAQSSQKNLVQKFLAFIIVKEKWVVSEESMGTLISNIAPHHRGIRISSVCENRRLNKSEVAARQQKKPCVASVVEHVLI